MARTISHRGVKSALEKVRGNAVHDSVADFMRVGAISGPVTAPRFVRDLSNAFIDAYAKRQDADYNLSEAMSEEDARLLRLRVRRVIRGWRAATGRADQETKKAICVLMLLKGQLRAEP